MKTKFSKSILQALSSPFVYLPVVFLASENYPTITFLEDFGFGFWFAFLQNFLSTDETRTRTEIRQAGAIPSRDC